MLVGCQFYLAGFRAKLSEAVVQTLRNEQYYSM